MTGTTLIHPFHTLPAQLSIVHENGSVDVTGTMLIHPFHTLPAQLSIVHETGNDVTGYYVDPSIPYITCSAVHSPWEWYWCDWYYVAPSIPYITCSAVLSI